jgi:type II secretory ATPase GspE/PulE/Tfp pilus assembly ATPase PilB-like protein
MPITISASDIHIVLEKRQTEIRFRKDGTLVNYNSAASNAPIARIKIMCDLDISEKRKPQDGKN